MRLFPDDPKEFDSPSERGFDLLLCDGVALYLEQTGQQLLDTPVSDDIPAMPREAVQHLDVLLARQRRKIGLKRCVKIVSKAAQRVAVVLVIFGIALGVAYIKVDAVRTTVNNFFINITEDYVGFSSQPGQAILPEGELYYYPEFIPDGYVLASTQTFDDYSEIKFVNHDNWFNFKQVPFYGTDFHISGDSSIQIVYINGIKGQVSLIDGECYLLWHNDTTVFSIRGSIDSELALQIAESVYF